MKNKIIMIVGELVLIAGSVIIVFSYWGFVCYLALIPMLLTVGEKEEK